FFATELQSIEIKEIHKAVIETVRSWAEQVEETLIECRGQDEGQRLFNKYSDSFEDSYRALVDPAIVADDILDLESVEEDLKIRWGLADHRKDRTYLKIFSRDRKLPISEITPILVNHGFIVEEENAYCFADVPGKDEYRDIYLHVYRVKTSSRAKFIRDEMGNNICENIKNTYDNTVENDVLAGLIAITNFSSRELEILRTIRNYARQINAVPTRQSVNQALLDHPRAAGLCLRAFTGKFDPVSGSLEKFKSVKRDFKRYLSSVRSIDDDKILRVLFNIIDASVRTSFYVEDNNHRYKQGIAPIAIKVDCDRIHNMPDPRPWREIFIYGGGTLEGCHLRAGPVARGGLRWSERPDDFRTEILGLLKAQVPKNAQIVPTGAKGGFVAKNLPEDKSLWFAEVKKCYGIFISALLDIQDNLVPGSSNGRSTTTQHPENVVCYDADDSYFVVAADKGTASFPDFANEISKYAGFWLGDAFASGGSIGYDHKKEGITARGAWVSARRNFRERSVDVDKIPITVVGVGDMSGDVFGNGMLCCKKTKLIAAFDHRHIFIDPNPDTYVSYEERKRLFRLPRSSWDNYDRKCLSKGGGIYARSQKTIKISAEAMMALGVDEKQMEPNALMCAMLRAPVDLFYNGGIGTYVKAENERNIEVGDPQNDQNRINAKELRCKVVCEGGNLGLTQAARIEFARKGGKIYADAIDNSAGVDLSDHEVNLKILLNSAVNPTEKELRQYMNRFKKEVVADVLYDSYCQTLGVSLDEIRSRSNINLFAKMISDWEKKGLIDRELEGLPDQEFMDDLAVRGEGLTKPELGVLLANAKIDAKHRLLETPVIKSKYMSQYGAFYFSPLIRKEFKKEIGSHRLKRDITATVLSNIIVNFHGATGLYQLTTELGLATSRVVEALLAAHRILDAIDIQSSLFQLDLKLPAHRQYEEHLRVDKAVRVTARWLVKNVRDLRSKLVTGLTEYNEMHKKFAPLVNKILPDKDRRIYRVGVSHLISEGIPEKLAHRLILLDYMPTLLDARKVATRKKVNIAKAAKTIYQVGDRLKMGFLITRIASCVQRQTGTIRRMTILSLIFGPRDGESPNESSILGQLWTNIWKRTFDPAIPFRLL
ncbi:MAG: NAD-glutamate dehydrogenase, partial [Candidatus Lindowbacteria bacterium]|nr:NAD-glutamate dehydrogenase [Candidatus Lindowbacteria bacterium]